MSLSLHFRAQRSNEPPKKMNLALAVTEDSGSSVPHLSGLPENASLSFCHKLDDSAEITPNTKANKVSETEDSFESQNEK